MFNRDELLQNIQTNQLQQLDLSYQWIQAPPIKVSEVDVGGYVKSLVVLPQGQLAIGSSDDNSKLWDTKSHQCLPISIKSINHHYHGIDSFVVLPAGRLAVGGDQIIEIWDMKTLQCVATLKGHTVVGWTQGWSNTSALAILPDGRLASASDDTTIKLWDTKTYQCLATLRGHKYGVCCLAVLPGDRLASGGRDSTIKLWNTKTHDFLWTWQTMDNTECLATLVGHDHGVIALATLPDGRLASGSYDNTIKLWDTKTYQCLATLRGHNDAVECLAVLSAGRLASGSRDRTIKLWHLKTLQCVATLTEHSDKVKALAVLPNGQLASGSSDSTVKLWDINTRLLSLNDMTPLLKALETNRSIHTVTLQKTLIQDTDLSAFTHLLKTNTTITELDLRETPITVNGINTLTAQLKTRFTSLKLQYNGGVINLSVAITADVNWSHSYQIPFNDLTIGKELGRGGFGIVYQGTWRYNPVAIKQLLSKPSNDAIAEFTAEAQIMARLRSPNIVQFYGYFLGNPQYGIVMEYMSKGSLYHVLHSRENLSWETRYKILCDMARGLAFLHAEDILHRDLKSLNVLLDEHMRAKLSDFGLAKIKTEMRTTSSNEKSVGTIAWMAPELFQRKATCTKKSDIYSLGFTFWEVASRKIPFAEAANPAVIPTWIERGEREEIPLDCPPKLASLIKRCWEQDAKKRPSAEEVVQSLTSEAQDASDLDSKPTYLGNLSSQSSVDGKLASFRSRK
ncbi:MAG: protein kinase [Pseudomonadota bacterium]